MCRRIIPFLLNLPSEILINILSRLPIQTILSCKCVCKLLLGLLSTPEFATSHLPLSTPGLVILYSDTFVKLCQIFEFEDGVELQNSNLHLSPVMKFDPNVSMGLPDDAGLAVVGSVNGLLCLREFGKSAGYDALYICNPITREYISLPRIEASVEYFSDYGFGQSKISGQYKVVRYVHRHSDDRQAWPCSGVQNYECLVYTVGTRSWRSVQPGPPFGHYDFSFNMFLNGNLHGCVQDYCGSTDKLIYCFDLESELFKPFPQLPPSPYDGLVCGNLGILDDCLCFFENRSQDEGITALWVMKEYGVEGSWTEILVMSEVEDIVFTYEDSLYPIKAFKNGDILLNWNNFHMYYFNSETKTCQDLDLGIEEGGGCFEAIHHSLSFFSLNNFDGENVLSFSS